MISKLQKKLTLTALCTLVLIFVLVVAAINIAYGAVLRNQISQSLSILTGRYAESSVQSSRHDSANSRRSSRRSGFHCLPNDRFLRDPAEPKRRPARMEKRKYGAILR